MWQFDPLLYSKGARRRNFLPMQYCTLAPIILRKVDNINFAPYTFFDIFIKSNKSPKAMSSLRSTVRKLKIYTRHPPPGLSRDLYGQTYFLIFLTFWVLKIFKTGQLPGRISQKSKRIQTSSQNKKVSFLLEFHHTRGPRQRKLAVCELSSLQK